jgi:protein phosphatase
MHLTVPELSLVLLVGPSGAGKSTFARKHFRPTEVLTSDYFRALIRDDETDQSATKDAFEVLHLIAAKRLAVGRLTVIDATNVQAEARRPLLALARQYHCLPVAIVLNLPEKLCWERNQGRSDRSFGPHVIRQQNRELRRALKTLKREGFSHVYVLATPEDVENAVVERQPLWNDRRGDHGPFDIIGDVHGCGDELEKLLHVLGYETTAGAGGDLVYVHPQGRNAVFLGDLVDRGPHILDTVYIVRGMVNAGTALCVPGNHDMKLLRKLRGKDVRISHGLERTLAEIDALPEAVRGAFVKEMIDFFDGLISHYVLDDGKLIVAHAGLKEEMQGRGSRKVRDFALYGETTGETDEFGLPVRHNWAADYRGRAMVVYGHTPVPEADWLNRTINIDTGCVFGGKLTALRYPERELVAVAAARTYAEPVRPFLPAQPPRDPLSAQQEQDDVLDMEDVLGKRIISTRLRPATTVREENAAAALEVMSRFAVNPKWLIYLPPTMAPCATTGVADLLEHPAEAFAEYRAEGVNRVVCEEKHMGSRAVVIVCRDEAAVRQRFGVVGEGIGVCYTRTGRRFFDQLAVEAEFLARVNRALGAADFWARFRTDWVCLDCELMPWSAKAQELLRNQYAAVGAAARAALPEAVAALEAAAARDTATAALLARVRERSACTARYVAAYRRYCWPVLSVDDLRLAPFHILATEGAVHVDRDHLWHIQEIAKLCQAGDGLLLATPHRAVDLDDPAGEAEGVCWWEELTGRGGEGMVVKPFDFITRGPRGLVQPAVKCRGREYLRIIYGPEYTAPEHLERLRPRRLAAKRSLALREFALGIEALDRFVRREPLRRVHECCFGVLALESEPVDPRL